MSSAPAGPRCPRCHRPLAAWRLDHCVYCGEAFPADLKAGFTAPEALKWVERPALPADVSKKLEMMKVVPSQGPRKSRSFLAIAGVVSIPIFGAIFWLTKGGNLSVSDTRQRELPGVRAVPSPGKPREIPAPIDGKSAAAGEAREEV